MNIFPVYPSYLYDSSKQKLVIAKNIDMALDCIGSGGVGASNRDSWCSVCEKVIPKYTKHIKVKDVRICINCFRIFKGVL